MDWRSGYTASWTLARVNPETWADQAAIGGVDSASITRTAGGDLLESGSIAVTGAEPEPGYYRLVMVATQDGAAERVEGSTMLFEQTGGTADYGTVQRTMEGRSVLYPASVLSVAGANVLYCPAGVDGAAFVGDLLESCLDAPVSVECSFTLADAVVFDYPSASVLESCWSVLDAAGARLSIDGNGTVHIVMDTASKLELGDANARLLQYGIKYGADMSDVPNRYIAVGDYETAVAVNQSDGATSRDSRGWWHDEVDTSPKPLGNETLAAYAQRKLEEASTVGETRTYTREFLPGVYPGDTVHGSLAEQMLEGDMTVTKQRLKCGDGIAVTEEATKGVSLWS